MADITITPANVLKGSDAKVERSKNAGATITAGQIVYLDSDTDKWKLADANGATAALAVARGVALNNASDGQPLHVQEEGQITIGGTVVVGTIYVLSATAGGICPAADLATGHRTTILGVGITAAIIDLQIHVSGVAVP